MQVRKGKVDLCCEPRGFRFSPPNRGDVVLGGVKPHLVADPDRGHDFGGGLGRIPQSAEPANRGCCGHGEPAPVKRCHGAPTAN